MLVSEDERAAEKVGEWQQSSSTSTLVVPLILDTDDPESARIEVMAGLREILGDRDLYRAQNPVTGADFFGRRDMLRDVSASLQSDENIAVFGLRRSGKTSVLRELKRRLIDQSVILTMGDFQLLQEESIGSLARSIANNLHDDLRNAKRYGMDVKTRGSKAVEASRLSLPPMPLS